MTNNLLAPKDISGEFVRTYFYADFKIVIKKPIYLWISAESGSHRVQVDGGDVVYLPGNWHAIAWTPRDINNPIAF